MNIRPLTQLRELITAALGSQANLGKSFQSFFIETMGLFLTHTGRLNFTQMARCGRSCNEQGTGFVHLSARMKQDWLEP